MVMIVSNSMIITPESTNIITVFVSKSMPLFAIVATEYLFVVGSNFCLGAELLT